MSKPDNPVRRRPYGDPRRVPRSLRRAAEEMPLRQSGTALLDFCYTCQHLKQPITAITRSMVDDVARRFLASGDKSCGQRILAWRRALDLLPPAVKVEFDIREDFVNPRGIRLLSEADGTFPQLAKDVSAAVATATRPRTDLADPHNPVGSAYALKSAKRLHIIASVLYRHNVIDRSVTLSELISPETITKYLQIIDGCLPDADPDLDCNR